MNNSWRVAIFIIVVVLLITIVTLLIVLPLIKKKKKESYPTLKSALVEYFAQLYPVSKKSSWANMSQNQLYNLYKGLLIYYLPLVDKSVVTDSNQSRCAFFGTNGKCYPLKPNSRCDVRLPGGSMCDCHNSYPPGCRQGSDGTMFNIDDCPNWDGFIYVLTGMDILNFKGIPNNSYYEGLVYPGMYGFGAQWGAGDFKFKAGCKDGIFYKGVPQRYDWEDYNDLERPRHMIIEGYCDNCTYGDEYKYLKRYTGYEYHQPKRQIEDGIFESRPNGSNYAKKVIRAVENVEAGSQASYSNPIPTSFYPYSSVIHTYYAKGLGQFWNTGPNTVVAGSKLGFLIKYGGYRLWDIGINSEMNLFRRRGGILEYSYFQRLNDQIIAVQLKYHKQFKEACEYLENVYLTGVTDKGPGGAKYMECLRRNMPIPFINYKGKEYPDPDCMSYTYGSDLDQAVAHLAYKMNISSLQLTCEPQPPQGASRQYAIIISLFSNTKQVANPCSRLWMVDPTADLDTFMDKGYVSSGNVAIPYDFEKMNLTTNMDNAGKYPVINP
jgi:hypothetical protein